MQDLDNYEFSLDLNQARSRRVLHWNFLNGPVIQFSWIVEIIFVIGTLLSGEMDFLWGAHLSKKLASLILMNDIFNIGGRKVNFEPT